MSSDVAFPDSSASRRQPTDVRGVVKELTEIVAAAAGDPSYAERTWVLITESPEGGWGIAGRANTNADIAALARAALAGN